MVIALPRDPNEVVDWLAFLGSEQGFTISNEYLYVDGNPFPNQLDQKVGEQPRLPFALLNLQPMAIEEIGVITPKPSPPGTMTREDVEAALVEMGVDGGYAAATPEQLTYARVNVLWLWANPVEQRIVGTRMGVEDGTSEE